MKRVRWRLLAVTAGVALLAACGGPGPSAKPPGQSPTAVAPAESPSAPLPTPSPSARLPSPATRPPSPRATATPSPSGAFLPVGLLGTEWSRLPTNSRIVALTFDAGSGAQGLTNILAALKAAGVPGTFFLTGEWVEKYPDGARQIAAVPEHSIGNHSYDHPYFTTLSAAEMDGELLRTQEIIERATGRNPKPIFRFPYGDSNATTVAEINRLGYGSIRWTIDTLGWKGAATGQSTSTIRSRVLAGLQPGEIVLMHVGAAEDGSTLDADALAGMISDLKSRGYGFVAVWDYVEGLVAG